MDRLGWREGNDVRPRWAEASYVREQLGFASGGVPTYIDADLLTFRELNEPLTAALDLVYEMAVNQTTV